MRNTPKQTKKVRTPKKAPDTPFTVADFKCNLWKDEKEALASFGISKEVLTSANISWQELAAIYIDHEKNLISLQSYGDSVSQMLQRNPYVNSVKSRVKDPVHLLQKIVRKRTEFRDIGLHNYKAVITDLVGVRVLHVLKTEWLPINQSIIDTFKLKANTSPVAYITDADKAKWEEFYTSNGCRCEVNDRNYKSVHYDVEIGFTKEKTFLEIQARTINEEAWGELDHKINYPIRATQVVADFIRAANMLSSTADELSQHIIMVNEQLTLNNAEQEKLKAEKETALTEVNSLVSKLKISAAEKEKLQRALTGYEKSTQRSVATIGQSQVISPGIQIGIGQGYVAFNPPGTIINGTSGFNHSTLNNMSGTLSVNAINQRKCAKCKKDISAFSISAYCDDCSRTNLVRL